MKINADQIRLNNYIDELMQHQNYGTAKYNQNLVSKGEYIKILNSAITLDQNINYLINETKIISGYVTCFGTVTQKHFLFDGTIDDRCPTRIKSNNYDENTIIDLASVTKIFTIVAVMQLYENGDFKFNDPISKYLPEFKNISEITIYDILRFKYAFQTKERIDLCKTFEEADNCLKSIFLPQKNNTRTYNDFSAIIAGKLVEKITTISFKKYVFDHIILPCKMYDTYTIVPHKFYDRISCTDYEYRVLDDKSFIEKRTLLGQINDEKARILSNNGENLAGHSGLFSTANDISKFCKSLLNNELLSLQTLLLIGSLHTGFFDNNTCSQHLGLLCYSKSPIEMDSEIYKGLSGNTIAISGYTGTYLMIDALNKCYCFIGANRLNNRISRLPADLSNRISLLCPLDNTYKMNSKNYVYLKDEKLRDPICKILLQMRYHEICE